MAAAFQAPSEYLPYMKPVSKPRQSSAQTGIATRLGEKTDSRRDGFQATVPPRLIMIERRLGGMDKGARIAPSDSYENPTLFGGKRAQAVTLYTGKPIQATLPVAHVLPIHDFRPATCITSSLESILNADG